MKITYNFLLLFCLVCFTANISFAQKQFDRIFDYYEVKAYHLTIKKIHQLKPQLKAKAEIQYILADCYWNAGRQQESLQLYKGISRVTKVPTFFKEKYAIALQLELKNKKYKPFQINSQQVSNVFAAQPVLPGKPMMVSKMSIKKVEPTVDIKENKPAFVVAPIIISKKSKPIPVAIKSLGKCTEAAIKKPSVTEKKVSTLFDVFNENDSKISGAYRIRIAINMDEETNELALIQNLKTVSSFNWVGKKIIFAGYFDSLEKAQLVVKKYLKPTYKNVVVVVKKGDRYKSVEPELVFNK